MFIFDAFVDIADSTINEAAAIANPENIIETGFGNSSDDDKIYDSSGIEIGYKNEDGEVILND